MREVISIDDARQWKPARAAYLQAAHALGSPPGDLALVATHAWDVHGARHAGFVTGWVRRQERHFHDMMGRADITGESLVDVVEGLLRLPRGSDIEARPDT